MKVRPMKCTIGVTGWRIVYCLYITFVKCRFEKWKFTRMKESDIFAYWYREKNWTILGENFYFQLLHFACLNSLTWCIFPHHCKISNYFEILVSFKLWIIPMINYQFSISTIGTPWQSQIAFWGGSFFLYFCVISFAFVEGGGKFLGGERGRFLILRGVSRW